MKDTPVITWGVLHNRGSDTLPEMNTTPWRDRVRQEEELVEQLRNQTAQALKRRAEALRDGAAELGSVYAVAKDLGKSWTAINKAINKHTTP